MLCLQPNHHRLSLKVFKPDGRERETEESPCDKFSLRPDKKVTVQVRGVGKLD